MIASCDPVQQQYQARNLVPGKYIIVPLTTGIRHAAPAAPAHAPALKANGRLTGAARDAVRKIFTLFDQVRLMTMNIHPHA